MTPDVKDKLTSIEKQVIEFMRCFIDMCKLTEEKILNIKKYILSDQPTYFINKLVDRHGDENKFVHPFMMIKFNDECTKFEVTFNTQMDDDRETSNKIIRVRKNYGFRNERWTEHGLLGGWSYTFKFEIHELDLFKQLMSEVV